MSEGFQPIAQIACEFRFEASHQLRREDWSDPPALQRALADMPGVVEHGMFLGMAAAAYVAAADGVRVLVP